MNNNYETLSQYSKDELIELIAMYSKNWLAHDGVWFQAIEKKAGMDDAMYYDIEAWRRFTVIEAKKIKAFLNLPEKAGLAAPASVCQYQQRQDRNRGQHPDLHYR